MLQNNVGIVSSTFPVKRCSN